MGAADQLTFNNLRAAHYPPERNHLPAHAVQRRGLPQLGGLVGGACGAGAEPAARINQRQLEETKIRIRYCSQE